jgi:hypothetical protein
MVDMNVFSKHTYEDEPKDCVLYIIARSSDENIRVIDDGKSVRVEVIGVNVHKYMYIGITNDFERRMGQHMRSALNRFYTKSAKFYNRIKSHGWDAYEKRVLVSGLTRAEALALEIDTIARYRTFEFGLNSTPGGDGCGFGAEHPCAQAVNLYNNATGDIHSFTWMGAASKFLGLGSDQGKRVSAAASPNCYTAQLQSKLTGEWFQGKYAYDETPFEEFMPTPGEKISGAEHHTTHPVKLYNNVSGEIHSFTWMGAAAEFLGLGSDQGNRVSAAASPNCYTAQLQSKLTGEWFQAKYAYDETPFGFMPTRYEKTSGYNNWNAQAVNLYNNTSGEIRLFTWMGAAAEFLGLDARQGSRVSNVVDPNCENAQIQSKLSGEWFQAKYVFDNTPFEFMPPPNEKRAKSKEKAVVAYDENDKIVFRFDSAKKAMTATKIDDSTINMCAQHERNYAGKKDGSKLSWEYEDQSERAKYDHIQRKPKKPFYYIVNGVNIYFKTVKDAAKQTSGKYAVGTQCRTISASIESGSRCMSGFVWFKKTPVDADE